MINVVTGKIDFINLKEAKRYLGYARGAGSVEGVEEVFSECEKLVLAAQNLKACYQIYDISYNGESLNLGFTKVISHSLARNLNGCNKAVLFACTAGAQIDRLIAKYMRISPARAAVIQAMGAALVEQWCDELCKSFTAAYGATNPRFSCGYGDLPITMQRDIFAALNVTKHLGITLSDDCFMTPTKSVTAIVGLRG